MMAYKRFSRYTRDSINPKSSGAVGEAYRVSDTASLFFLRRLYVSWTDPPLLRCGLPGGLTELLGARR